MPRRPFGELAWNDPGAESLDDLVVGPVRRFIIYFTELSKDIKMKTT